MISGTLSSSMPAEQYEHSTDRGLFGFPHEMCAQSKPGFGVNGCVGFDIGFYQWNVTPDIALTDLVRMLGRELFDHNGLL
jgi:hypothetical protein